MSFVLAHCSDLHIGPLPRASAWQLLGKRATGYINWHRGGRAAMHRPDVLEALIADMHKHRPDHIAVTGDMVNLALGEEFRAGKAMLETIGPPDRVSFVAGNHDAYTLFNRASALRAFGPYMTSDHEPVAQTMRDAFPYVRRRGPLALIGLNSGVPKMPFFATGTVGHRQLTQLGEMLRALKAEGLMRVVLIHHPPFAIMRMARLTDWRALQMVLAREGAELVLHGHTHHGTIELVAGVPAVGVPSASMAPGYHQEAAGWNEFAFSGGRIMLTRHALTDDGFRPLYTRSLMT